MPCLADHYLCAFCHVAAPSARLRPGEWKMNMPFKVRSARLCFTAITGRNDPVGNERILWLRRSAAKPERQMNKPFKHASEAFI
jgi:hypothetical protein